jgi:hypothetical protein
VVADGLRDSLGRTDRDLRPSEAVLLTGPKA